MIKEILVQLLHEVEYGEDSVLVTLVSGQGSVPQGAGAQMLVSSKGRLVGTVGGGTVEKICIETAVTLLQEGRTSIREFRLRPNDDQDIGMVCGGEVAAHFQFISAGSQAWRDISRLILDCLNTHQGGWLLMREDGGDPLFLRREEALSDSGLRACGLPAAALAICQTTCARGGGWFSIPLPADCRAILFGAGHIAQKLCPLLRSVDFVPVIFDDRPDYARPELFPDAQQVILGNFAHIASDLSISGEDYLVVMTSGHIHDFEVEEQVLRGDFAYLGVIGSRTKIAAVNQRLLVCGITSQRLEEVHSPIGTPIHSVTPAEIAVSIAGEMISVRALRRASGDARRPCPMD